MTEKKEERRCLECGTTRDVEIYLDTTSPDVTPFHFDCCKVCAKKLGVKKK